jgi:phage regulator Rha-like protein
MRKLSNFTKHFVSVFDFCKEELELRHKLELTDVDLQKVIHDKVQQ